MGRLRAWYGGLARGSKWFLWGVIALVVIVALADDPPPQPTENEPVAAAEGENTEAEVARRETEEARQEAEDAKEQAAQAKQEAEEAEAAKAEAQPSDSKSSSSDADTETVTIRVTGTPGSAFSGSYGNLDSTRSVDGVTPAEFEVEIETGFLTFDSVSAVMQKTDFGSAELRVEMVVDGEVVKDESTTAEFGVAQVNYVPGE